MPLLFLRNCPHYYEWITDEGFQRTGRPVLVFIHGWGGSARYWQRTAQALTPHFDCLLYDLRGFGRSQWDTLPLEETRYTLDTYAEDLAQLLEQLGIDRICLNAHSLGTSIATFFLNEFGGAVDRVILTCGGIFEYDELAFAAFYRFGRYVVKFRPSWLYRLPGMDQVLMQRFLYRPIAASDRQAFVEDYLMAAEPAALGTMFDAVSKRATEVLPQQFANLKVPTLLISGEHDRIIPPQLGRSAASLSDRIDYVIMGNVGHFPMLENADNYLKMVRSFLGIDPP